MMHAREWLKANINACLALFGYKFCRWPPQVPNPQRKDPAFRMDSALARAARRTPGIAGIIDIGASDGRWSKLAMRHFPAAKYLLIEGQNEHEAALQAFAASRANVTFRIAAAGNREGQINFRSGKLFGGAASLTPFSGDNREVPMITIDKAVIEARMKGPFLIKLDTHGFETEILDGASEVLEETVVIVVETYNFANNKRLRFFEMCEFLEQRGFRSADICDVVLRPYDELLWQMDLVFLRAEHPAFDFTGFDAPS